MQDLLRFKGGEARWAEVKFKDSPVLWRAQNQLRHGIDTPNWNAYDQIERGSKIPGDLSIVEYKPDEAAEPAPKLLIQSVQKLRGLIAGDSAPGREFPHGGTFWERRHFDVVATQFSELLTNELTVKEKLRAWRRGKVSEPRTQRDWRRKCGIRGCNGYVPAHRTMADGMLCNEHYAQVSDDVVNAWIRKRLEEG